MCTSCHEDKYFDEEVNKCRVCDDPLCNRCPDYSDVCLSCTDGYYIEGNECV